MFNCMPFLLTNLPKTISITPKHGQSTKAGITKLQYPNPIDLQAPLSIARTDIERHFSLLEGEFNLEGSWVCDIQTEFTGPLYLQVIFAKNDGESLSTLDILG